MIDGTDPFAASNFNPLDPDPWLALYLDQSLPIDDRAKRALLLGNRSVSRRWLFPLMRPFIFATFLLKVLQSILWSRRRRHLGPCSNINAWLFACCLLACSETPEATGPRWLDNRPTAAEFASI